MSDIDQLDQPTTTTMVVKRSAASMLQSAVAPKADSHGRISRHIEVESLSLGGDVVVTGKLVIEHGHEDEASFVRSLLDGTGGDVVVKLQPGSKAKVWAETGFYAGPVRADGLSGKDVVLVEGGRAYAGTAVGGVGVGKGRVHANGEVYAGSVQDTLANGRGVLLSGQHALRGVFKDGKENGRFTVTNIEDGSVYQALYVDGTEQLSKRGKRKLSHTSIAYDDDDYDDDKEVQSVEAMEASIKAIKLRIKERKKAELANAPAEKEAEANA